MKEIFYRIYAARLFPDELRVHFPGRTPRAFISILATSYNVIYKCEKCLHREVHRLNVYYLHATAHRWHFPLPPGSSTGYNVSLQSAHCIIHRYYLLLYHCVSCRHGDEIRSSLCAVCVCVCVRKERETAKK